MCESVVEGMDLVVTGLIHRGYGAEEGQWIFGGPLLLLSGKAQWGGVSHIKALCDVFWGEETSLEKGSSARTVRLEMFFQGKHVVINRT